MSISQKVFFKNILGTLSVELLRASADLRPQVEVKANMEREEWAKNLSTTEALALYLLDFLFFCPFRFIPFFYFLTRGS